MMLLLYCNHTLPLALSPMLSLTLLSFLLVIPDQDIT